MRSLFLQIISSAPSQKYDRSIATTHKYDTREKIRNKERDKFLKKIGKPLDRYSELADILSKIIVRIREYIGVDMCIRLIRDRNSITTFLFQTIRLSNTPTPLVTSRIVPCIVFIFDLISTNLRRSSNRKKKKELACHAMCLIQLHLNQKKWSNGFSNPIKRLVFFHLYSHSNIQLFWQHRTYTRFDFFFHSRLLSMQ